MSSPFAKENLLCETVAELYNLALDLNLYGKAGEAFTVIVDGLWPVIDCVIIAPVEGVILGCKNTVIHSAELIHGLLFDTTNTLTNIVSGINQLAGLILRIHLENQIAPFAYTKAVLDWCEEYSIQLQLLKKLANKVIETPPRELIKEATALATEVFLTRQMHAAAGNILVRSAQAGLQLSNKALEAVEFLAEVNATGGMGEGLALADGGVVAVPVVIAESLAEPAILAEVTSATGLLAGVSKEIEYINRFAMDNQKQQDKKKERYGRDERGGANHITNKEARAIAKELGFEETKDYAFKAHGKLVFKKGDLYISADQDGHNGAFWKLQNKYGKRFGSYDKYLKTQICG